jgi:hypothetical protein
VHGLHLVSVGQTCDDGFVGKLYIGDGGVGGEEGACCVPESTMAHLLMVSMSMLAVQRSAVAASAYWVGIRQEGNRLWVNLILLSSSTPACQKLLYQP